MRAPPTVIKLGRAFRRVEWALRKEVARARHRATGFVPTAHGLLSSPLWSWPVSTMSVGLLEPLQTRVFAALAPGRVVWDLGAHYGYYTLVASHARASFVGAVEAAPSTFAHTQRTAAPHGHARVLNAALVEKAETDHVDFF